MRGCRKQRAAWFALRADEEFDERAGGCAVVMVDVEDCQVGGADAGDVGSWPYLQNESSERAADLVL